MEATHALLNNLFTHSREEILTAFREELAEVDKNGKNFPQIIMRREAFLHRGIADQAQQR